MGKSVSKFVWHDVMTTDVDAAEDFYAKVVGWQMKDSGMDGPRYTLLMDGERMAGGIMPTPDDASDVPPMWMGYIGVDDIDAKAKELEAAGGTVHRGPQDIPGIGRFAVVADPHGAGFIIFQPQGEGGPEAPFMAPKTIGWNELHAGNLDEAWPFYEALFGWQKLEAHDMGGFIYQTFGTGGETGIGGMMTKMESAPYPYWAYYISVADFDAAVQRARDNGATVLAEPMQVPGGIWICPAQDPQGAHFNLIGMRGEA